MHSKSFIYIYVCFYIYVCIYDALCWNDWFNFSSKSLKKVKGVYLELNSDELSSFKFVMRIFLSGSIVYYFLQEYIHDSSLGKQFASFYQKVSQCSDPLI
jgi:hypothetical protein